MSTFVSPGTRNHSPLQSEFIIALDELAVRGSVLARFRRENLDALDKMMRQWDASEGDNKSENEFDNPLHVDSAQQVISRQALPEQTDIETTVGRLGQASDCSKRCAVYRPVAVFNPFDGRTTRYT